MLGNKKGFIKYIADEGLCMAKALYDLCKKDGTVMVYSITGPEVAEIIGCKLQDVYNSACYGQMIQNTYYAEAIDRPLSRRKDITLLTEYDRVRKEFLRKYRRSSEKRNIFR